LFERTAARLAATRFVLLRFFTLRFERFDLTIVFGAPAM
jgi:hypothetical protein